jgi:hypothetical protein
MASTAADRAFDAISDLIVEQAGATSPARFATIGRLAAVGDALRRAIGTRVADFAEPNDAAADGADGVEAVGQAGVYGVGQGGVYGVPLDQQALLRHLFLVLGPMAQTATDEHRARVAHHEAEELDTLLGLVRRKNLDPALRAQLKTRVDALKANLDARNGGASALVLPDVSRRHPAHGAERDRDGDARVRADAGGARGGAGAPQEGAVDRVGA